MQQSERVTLQFPPGLDPNRVKAKLVKMLAEQHGEGFEIDSIDTHAGIAYASRQSELTQISDAADDAELKYVKLGKGVKAGDGDRQAARLAEQYAHLANDRGAFEMTKFTPFLGTAELTRLDPETSRARAAVAVALGVKPWDVTVTPRAKGGFDIKLPNSYVQSKHDDKLTEVAESVVGRPGWYVESSPKRLTASIIPGEPPTFPPSMPYPMPMLRKADSTKLLIGRALSDRAETAGADVYIDFEQSAHSMVSGTSGSGKSVTLHGMISYALAAGHELAVVDLPHKAQPLTTRIPVPISERFKDGWALLGDLNVGDFVFAADGSPTEVTALTPIWDGDVYELAFSDGQTVRADAGHLWHVVSRADRARRSPSYIRARARAAQVASSRLDERLSRLQGRAAAAPDRLGTARLAELIECGAAYVTQLASRFGMRPTADGYVVADFLRRYESLLRDSLEAQSAPKPSGRLLATAELAASFRVGKRDLSNYSVPNADPVQGPDVDLPIPPYLLGAWLGDGSAGSCGITTGLDDAEEMASLLSAEWTCDARMKNGRPGSTQTIVLPRRDDRLCPYGHDDFRIGRTGTRSCRSCPRPGGRAGQRNTSLYSRLQAEGLRNNKHIPAAYLRASYDQRLALLQGLMDTDGSATRDGYCIFVSVSDAITTGLVELCRSLGIAPKVSRGVTALTEDDGHGGRRRRVVGEANRVSFTTDLPVFRLRRKLSRLRSRLSESTRQRFIVDVRRVDSEPVRCITVAHPDHLYLTEGFIPTHNCVDFVDFRKYVRPGGWGCATPTTTTAEWLPEALTTLALVYEEGMRRAGLLAEHNVTKVGDLPAHAAVRPIFVVCDEVTGILQLDDVPKGVPKDHPMVVEANQSNLMRQMILSYMKKIAAELRFAGIRMVLSSQVSSVNTGVPTSLRMNLAQKLLLGPNPTEGNRKLSLADPGSVPYVPDNVKADGRAGKGVGVAELEGQANVVFKSFFATPAQLTAELDRLGVPTTDQPRPTAAQIQKHTPALGEDDGGGRPARSGTADDDYGYAQQSDGEFLRDFDQKREGGFAGANEARRQLDAAAGTARRKPVEIAQAGPVTVRKVGDPVPAAAPFDEPAITMPRKSAINPSGAQMCPTCDRPMDPISGACACSR